MTFQNLAKNTSWPGRSLIVAALIAMSILGPVSLAGAEDRPTATVSLEELEQEIARLDADQAAWRAERGLAPKVGGPVTCGDDYCQGLYEDLLTYRYEREDGYSTLRATPVVETALAASSHGCASTQLIILRDGTATDANRNAVISRWVSDMTAARALGEEIRLEWKQSNYSWGAVCNLSALYLYPAS